MSTERMAPREHHQVRGFRIREAGEAGAEFASGEATHARVGRAEGNDFVVDDPTVSRVHLRVWATPTSVRVEDVGSTNGSWIAGARFRQIELEQSADVKIGQRVVRIEVDVARPAQTSRAEGFGRLRGRSMAMQRVFREMEFAARSKDLAVLIFGETGTGKEIAARALHDAGPRAQGPFVVVDCAGLSPSLIESELFGHARGAFTDARTARPGPFEAAQGGTVFLDEVGELPLAQQSKLLRVLQERQVQRVGSIKPVKIDVKVLAATRRALLDEVNEGKFREDLYFRLAGEELFLPPLRERLEDLPLLVDAITEELLAHDEGWSRREVPPDVRAELARHPWPGNVRELRHCLHRYLLRGELSAPRSFSRVVAAAGRLAVDDLLPLSFADAVREFERRFVRAALEHDAGNHTRASRRLQIDRSTLYRILSR